MNINGKLYDNDDSGIYAFICQKEDESYIKKLKKSVRPLFPSDPSKKSLHQNIKKNNKLI